MEAKKKERVGPLSKTQCNVLIGWIVERKCPTVSELRDAEFPFFQTKAADPESYAKTRFKNWASKLAVNQGTLVYEATGKKIIPTEDTATVVMELHRMDGWHNSLKFTMDKLKDSYSLGRRSFGPSGETIRSIVMSCPDPNCKFRSRKEIQRSDVGFIPDTDASTCFSSQSGADRSSLQDVQDMEPMMSPVRGSGGQQTSGNTTQAGPSAVEQTPMDSSAGVNSLKLSDGITLVPPALPNLFGSPLELSPERTFDQPATPSRQESPQWVSAEKTVDPPVVPGLPVPPLGPLTSLSVLPVTLGSQHNDGLLPAVSGSRTDTINVTVAPSESADKSCPPVHIEPTVIAPIEDPDSSKDESVSIHQTETEPYSSMDSGRQVIAGFVSRLLGSDISQSEVADEGERVQPWGADKRPHSRACSSTPSASFQSDTSWDSCVPSDGGLAIADVRSVPLSEFVEVTPTTDATTVPQQVIKPRCPSSGASWPETGSSGRADVVTQPRQLARLVTREMAIILPRPTVSSRPGGSQCSVQPPLSSVFNGSGILPKDLPHIYNCPDSSSVFPRSEVHLNQSFSNPQKDSVRVPILPPNTLDVNLFGCSQRMKTEIGGSGVVEPPRQEVSSSSDVSQSASSRAAVPLPAPSASQGHFLVVQMRSASNSRDVDSPRKSQKTDVDRRNTTESVVKADGATPAVSGETGREPRKKTSAIYEMDSGAVTYLRQKFLQKWQNKEQSSEMGWTKKFVEAVDGMDRDREKSEVKQNADTKSDRGTDPHSESVQQLLRLSRAGSTRRHSGAQPAGAEDPVAQGRAVIEALVAKLKDNQLAESTGDGKRNDSVAKRPSSPSGVPTSVVLDAPQPTEFGVSEQPEQSASPNHACVEPSEPDSLAPSLGELSSDSEDTDTASETDVSEALSEAGPASKPVSVSLKEELKGFVPKREHRQPEPTTFSLPEDYFSPEPGPSAEKNAAQVNRTPAARHVLPELPVNLPPLHRTGIGVPLVKSLRPSASGENATLPATGISSLPVSATRTPEVPVFGSRRLSSGNDETSQKLSESKAVSTQTGLNMAKGDCQRRSTSVGAQSSMIEPRVDRSVPPPAHGALRSNKISDEPLDYSMKTLKQSEKTSDPSQGTADSNECVLDLSLKKTVPRDKANDHRNSRSPLVPVASVKPLVPRVVRSKSRDGPRDPSRAAERAPVPAGDARSEAIDSFMNNLRTEGQSQGGRQSPPQVSRSKSVDTSAEDSKSEAIDSFMNNLRSEGRNQGYGELDTGDRQSPPEVSDDKPVDTSRKESEAIDSFMNNLRNMTSRAADGEQGSDGHQAPSTDSADDQRDQRAEAIDSFMSNIRGRVLTAEAGAGTDRQTSAREGPKPTENSAIFRSSSRDQKEEGNTVRKVGSVFGLDQREVLRKVLNAVKDANGGGVAGEGPVIGSTKAATANADIKEVSALDLSPRKGKKIVPSNVECKASLSLLESQHPAVKPIQNQSGAQRTDRKIEQTFVSEAEISELRKTCLEKLDSLKKHGSDVAKDLVTSSERQSRQPCKRKSNRPEKNCKNTNVEYIPPISERVKRFRRNSGLSSTKEEGIEISERPKRRGNVSPIGEPPEKRARTFSSNVTESQGKWTPQSASSTTKLRTRSSDGPLSTSDRPKGEEQPDEVDVASIGQLRRSIMEGDRSKGFRPKSGNSSADVSERVCTEETKWNSTSRSVRAEDCTPETRSKLSGQEISLADSDSVMLDTANKHPSPAVPLEPGPSVERTVSKPALEDQQGNSLKHEKEETPTPHQRVEQLKTNEMWHYSPPSKNSFKSTLRRITAPFPPEKPPKSEEKPGNKTSPEETTVKSSAQKKENTVLCKMDTTQKKLLEDSVSPESPVLNKSLEVVNLLSPVSVQDVTQTSSSQSAKSSTRASGSEHLHGDSYVSTSTSSSSGVARQGRDWLVTKYPELSKSKDDIVEVGAVAPGPRPKVRPPSCSNLKKVQNGVTTTVRAQQKPVQGHRNSPPKDVVFSQQNAARNSKIQNSYFTSKVSAGPTALATPKSSSTQAAAKASLAAKRSLALDRKLQSFKSSGGRKTTTTFRNGFDAKAFLAKQRFEAHNVRTKAVQKQSERQKFDLLIDIKQQINAFRQMHQPLVTTECTMEGLSKYREALERLQGTVRDCRAALQREESADASAKRLRDGKKP